VSQLILAGFALGVLKNFLLLELKIFFLYIDDNKIKERKIIYLNLKWWVASHKALLYCH